MEDRNKTPHLSVHKSCTLNTHINLYCSFEHLPCLKMLCVSRYKYHHEINMAGQLKGEQVTAVFQQWRRCATLPQSCSRDRMRGEEG